MCSVPSEARQKSKCYDLKCINRLKLNLTRYGKVANTTSHLYLVGVSGLNTWSRFYRTPAGLQTSKMTVRKPAHFLLSWEKWGCRTHRKCRGCRWWEQTCWGRTGSQRCRTEAWSTGTQITDQRCQFDKRQEIYPHCFGDCVFSKPLDYLDDDLQGFDLLVRGPGLLQGLVQLLNAVGVILLGEVQQLSLGALNTQTNKASSQHFLDSLCLVQVMVNSNLLNIYLSTNLFNY